MRPIAVLLTLTVLCVSVASRSSAQNAQADSTVTPRIIFVEPGMAPGSTLILLPPQLEQPLPFSSPTFFFKDFISSSASLDFGRALEVRPDLLAPLRAQWEREAKLGAFRTILGSIQIGGVAYLAYRQLAKSGPMTIRSRAEKNRRK